MASQSVLLYLIILSLVKFKCLQAQENCPQSDSGSGLPPFRNYGGGGGSESRRITVGHQAIITTYKFDCDQMCGNITAWGVDVQPGGRGHDNRYALDLQVWRPSPTVDDSTGTGCYSLVGNNRFTSIPLAGDLARVTPSPQDYITFQPGDVLGFYIEEGRENDNGVNVLTSPSRYTSELVWYANIESTTSVIGSCPYSIGLNGVLDTLTRAAPVISIATTSVPCPRSSGQANVGRTFGILFAVLIVIALVVITIVAIALLIHKHEARVNALTTRGREFLSNLYSNNPDGITTKSSGQSSVNTAATNGDTNCGAYDYVLDESPNTCIALDKVDPQKKSTRNEHERPTNICHDALIHMSNSTTSNRYAVLESPLDVFDQAGFYVLTLREREKLVDGHYEMKPTQAYNHLQFFVEEDDYWAPAVTTSDLYTQLASRKYREIPRDQLTVLERLGSGEFGEVCKALWSIAGATKELAVKTVRPQLPEEEKVRFLQEAAIMGQFCHPNVVKLYGVVTLGDPVMICIELLSIGDLRNYLCSKNSSTVETQKHLEKQLLQFSKQIASGMNYLSSKSFVHRDLAARNILLDKSLMCKIADFGMARDLEDETYYTPTSKVGKIPVKWTAPEALLYKKYSTDSDVWSYGMVLFEIWSVGMKPFSQFTNSEVLDLIRSTYNQPPPPGCPRAMYKLMVDCWHRIHSKRPSFSEICDYFKTPAKELLGWSNQDSVTSPQGRILGAPLSESQSLYEDLQNIYSDYV